MRKVPYASVVGSLMYAMVCTRPDITFVMGTVRRYMSNLGQEHWATIEWILGYLKDTSKVCLTFGVGKSVLEGCTDSDMSGDVHSSRSTSGYVILCRGSSVMAVKTAEVCGLLDHRSRVYGSGRGRQGADFDEEIPQ